MTKMIAKFFGVFVVAAAFLAGLSVHAANGTWTNAPASAYWTNTLNWVGAVPGVVNNNANNGIDNSVATFNTPLASGVGGALNPIIIDDAVTNGTKGRMLGSILFSNNNCGPYVFYSPSPATFDGTSNPETGILNLSHNGSVTMAAEVTNSQTFLIPVAIRLPSSTAGIYNLVNNSTNDNAVLFFNVISNHSAATRGTTLVLSGSNKGTNTVAVFSKGPTTTGAMGLTKQGTGTWILPNTSDWNSQGVVTINNGTLIVKSQGAFGSVATATVVSNGVLQLDGVSLTNVTGGVTLATVALQNGGTLRMNGSGTNNIRLNTAAATSATIATVGSSDVLTINTNSGGAADTVLHVAGPGTVFLANTNAAYVGSWSVDAGTVQVGNNVALGSGQSAVVGAGAVLDFSPLGAISFNPSTTGVGGRGTGTSVGSTAATIKMAAGGVLDLATGTKTVSLSFAPTSFSGDTTHPALYISQGTLSLSQNQFTVNNTSGTPLGLGTYRLVQQASGSITDGGGCVAIVSGSGTAAGTVGLIQVSGGNVNLVVLTATALNLVWQGGNPNSVWDSATTTNWLNGGTPAVFNPSDSVTFNAVGSTNPVVTLSQTLLPNHVTVDTIANNYTLTGSGVIAGNANLAKVSSGTLLLQAKNTYQGGTVVSNGTLRVGIDNALPALGTVSVKSPAVLDLNTFSNIIGTLNGDGVVDNQGGGAATLIVGSSSDDVFSGVIQNTSGTLGLTKVGTGVETITGANTYSGPTIINNGTLRVGNANAISSTPVTLNIGTLDVRTSITVTSLVSLAGTSIANNSSATTNIITFIGGSTNISSVIADGTGGGGIGIYLQSGSLQLNNGNTYSGGTILASGTTLNIGSVNGVSSGNAGTGSIVASNGTTVALTSTVSTSSQLGSPITTVDGATVLFTGAQVADQFNGPFIGNANTTNIYGGNMSIGGGLTFSNFLGTVIFTNISANAVRFNNTVSGGDGATFDFQGGGIQTRDATVVHLGALQGNGGIYGPSVSAASASYWIGAKNLDTVYSGSIGGSNSIVKTGTGRLLLNGGTAQFSSFDSDLNLITNVFYTNIITYMFTTTISNGVLALAAPASLTNSSVVTLASSTAVLDASQMGYGVNEYETTGDGYLVLTNKYLVTNGVFEVISGHTLAGIGTIRAANVVLDSGSIFNVGLPLGSLTVTNGIELNGAVNMSVNATNTPNAAALIAQSITVGGGAVLTVTNLGSENAATFQLFNHAVTFGTVNLPVLSGTNTWVNNLAVDGSITLLAPPVVTVNTNSTNIVASVSGGSLTLS